MSNTQELHEINGVIDWTAGDADYITEVVIIHDTVGGHPSIISYDDTIAEALEEIAGPLPEEYEHLPEEYAGAYAWGNEDLSGYEAALGSRIELFADFLWEHSGIWTTLDGRMIQGEPTWTYNRGLATMTTRN